MSDSLRAAQPWLTFIGFVLVVAILYLAQPVIVPVALAVLFTFLLTPVVTWLQRRVGRIPAVLGVVVLTGAILATIGWIVTQQITGLVQELPAYQSNIRQKIRDVRSAGKGGSVEVVQKTVQDIESQIEEHPPGTPARPVVVQPAQVSGLWSFPALLTPFLGPLSTAGLVVALVIFMLLEREDLRNRLIRLFGHGRLVVTTKAFDEAGRRVSRYLLVQTFVNLIYGTGVGIGLYVLGVPYPILWGTLAAILRFIPYVGPIIAGAAPLLVALAALEGWTRPLLVLGLFVGLELVTNLVLESVLYADAIGVSQVALLIAVAFWSWLWGPMGLLLATPLTVCLAVMGKYVPGLEFVSTLISDEPVLTPDVAYYQRLLAGDPSEASDLLERHPADAGNIYDAVMLPALSYAERDRLEERLSPAEERAVVEVTRELLAEMDTLADNADALSIVATATTPVLGLAAEGSADILALQMLAKLLPDTPLALDIQERTALTSELIGALRAGRYDLICIADIPPSPSSRSRHLVKRLRAIAPTVPVFVGRWAPPDLADQDTAELVEAGATAVSSSLAECRDQLLRAVPGAREADAGGNAAPSSRGLGPSEEPSLTTLETPA